MYNLHSVKYEQAVSAMTGGPSLGSSSSSCGEKERSRDAEAEIRSLREELKRCKNAENRQGIQSETSVGENGCDDGWKIDIDEEVDSKKKLDQRKKELQKKMRNISECPDVPQDIREVLKEKWQQELQDIETKAELSHAREHQRMQKRSQKLQTCRTKRSSARRRWPNGLEIVGKPRMKSKKDRLTSKSVIKRLRRRSEWKRTLMNKADCAVQRMLFRHRRGSRFNLFKRSSTEDLKFQPLWCIRQEERKEEKRTLRSKHKEHPVANFFHPRQVATIKGFWLVLFWSCWVSTCKW